MPRRIVNYSACLTLSLAAGGAQGVEPTVDGPDPTETASVLGGASDDNFGRSMAGGGDFNGDGLADIVVGAPYADVTANASGAAYLYLGESFLNGTPDAILAGEAADDHAGISVAAGFDINGDQLDDIAVGVRLSDLGASDGGAVFIYLGTKNVDPQPTPDLKLLAESGDDWFGQSVFAAGDVNNDGFDDLVIGAPYSDAVANAAGRAYVAFGAMSMMDVTMTPIGGAAEANSHFGWAVGGAGDVNNDGFDDVIVGARLHGTGAGGGRGRAYIFLGGDPFDATPDIFLEGETKNDWFGESVAGLGDINGDQFDDVIVGAIFRDPNGMSAAGEASVFLGGDPMDAVRDLRIPGPHAHAQAGNAVGAAGDFNNDQFDDILVGAHFATTAGGSAAGQVMLVLGGQALDSAVDLTVSGMEAHAQLGESLAGTGKVVFGHPDAFGVGAHFDDESGSAAGRATIVWNTAICMGDANGDGVVNFTDVDTVLANWLADYTPGSGPGDADGDGLVTFSDIDTILLVWLSTCF